MRKLIQVLCTVLILAGLSLGQTYSGSLAFANTWTANNTFSGADNTFNGTGKVHLIGPELQLCNASPCGGSNIDARIGAGSFAANQLGIGTTNNFIIAFAVNGLGQANINTTGATFNPSAVFTPAGAVHAISNVASGSLPSATSAALVGDVNDALGSGTGTVYGVIGVSRAAGDVSGDKSYGGWFLATAQNLPGTEVGLHAEITGGGGTIAEFVQGSNKAVIPSNSLPTGTTNVTLTIASGTASMTTASIAAVSGTTVTCGATVTVSATNVLATDTISSNSNGSPSNPNSGLILQAWPTANNVNFAFCNPTASALTPSPETINWRVVR